VDVASRGRKDVVALCSHMCGFAGNPVLPRLWTQLPANHSNGVRDISTHYAI
jgi:hypothetical protein